jgi:hypothetical protein
MPQTWNCSQSRQKSSIVAIDEAYDSNEERKKALTKAAHEIANNSDSHASYMLASCELFESLSSYQSCVDTSHWALSFSS